MQPTLTKPPRRRWRIWLALAALAVAVGFVAWSFYVPAELRQLGGTWHLVRNAPDDSPEITFPAGAQLTVDGQRCVVRNPGEQDQTWFIEAGPKTGVINLCAPKSTRYTFLNVTFDHPTWLPGGGYDRIKLTYEVHGDRLQFWSPDNYEAPDAARRGVVWERREPH